MPGICVLGHVGTWWRHPLPKDPDRSHLADAIHFMDLIDLADEELPVARAAVEQAKAAAVTARTELDKHQQWLALRSHILAICRAIAPCESEGDPSRSARHPPPRPC